MDLRHLLELQISIVKSFERLTQILRTEKLIVKTPTMFDSMSSQCSFQRPLVCQCGMNFHRRLSVPCRSLMFTSIEIQQIFEVTVYLHDKFKQLRFSK
jgi:hypothetical protein